MANTKFFLVTVKEKKDPITQKNLALTGFSGSHYGIDFTRGKGVTEDEGLAARLKGRYKVESITKAQAKTHGYVSIEDRIAAAKEAEGEGESEKTEE